MYAGHEAEGSDAWQATGDVRSGGWPLGLQQPPMIRGFPEAPAFFLSTPSITSESSSDLDTESTGSFFPERSQTLGSLIGIQSNGAQNEQSKALVESHLMTEMTERRKSISGFRLSRGTSWCPMLGCRGGSNPESLGMSPSLAHLLEEERRATGSQRQSSSNLNDGGANESSLLLHRNTLFDEEGILPPQPSGAPLKLILQQSSPNSSYLSADWNVLNSTHPHDNTQQGAGGGAGASHGRFPTFWPGLCGRLGPGLAG